MVQPAINQLEEAHVCRRFRHHWRVEYLLPFLRLGPQRFFFGLEPGFRVPDPLVGEVVPPPLSCYRINAHKGPLSMEKTENPRASRRLIPSSAYTPNLGFF